MIILKILMGCSLFALTPPEYSKETNQLKLGKDLEKAINLYDPTFQVLSDKNFRSEVKELFIEKKEELPFALLADFNNDNIKDIALLGTTQQGARQPQVQLVLFVSQKKSYKAHLVQKWSSNQFINWVEKQTGSKELKDWGIYLRLLDKEEENNFRENQSLPLSNGLPLFAWEMYFGTTKTYYFYRNQVVSLTFKINTHSE